MYMARVYSSLLIYLRHQYLEERNITPLVLNISETQPVGCYCNLQDQGGHISPEQPILNYPDILHVYLAILENYKFCYHGQSYFEELLAESGVFIGWTSGLE